MNCFIWVLLLLGCGGNRCNSCSAWNNDCCDNCNCENMRDWRRRNNDCECEEMMERRGRSNDCDCDCDENRNSRSNNRSRRESGYMSPPSVPGRVRDNDDCGCND